MKKSIKLLVPAVCLMVLLASFGVTYAFLIANDSKVNEFSVGENEIELTEKFDSPEKLEPGISFAKEPYVINTGKLPCVVRMRADFSDSEAEKFCDVDFNTTNWSEKQADGYYYYIGILQPGDTTEPLFYKVNIKKKYDEQDGGEDVSENDLINFNIIVYAESKHMGSLPQNGNIPTDVDYYIGVWEGKQNEE